MAKTATRGLVVSVALLVLVLTVAASGSAAQPPGGESARPQGEAIIIDHTCTDLSQIPDYWLEQAKKLAFHYAHTSHGSQINTGLEVVEQETRSMTIPYSMPATTLHIAVLCGGDAVPLRRQHRPRPISRRMTTGARQTAELERGPWPTPGCLTIPCGPGAGSSRATRWQRCSSISIRMTEFEQEYPAMRFILMTGHTDGGGETLARNNDMVRQYAIDHGNGAVRLCRHREL